MVDQKINSVTKENKKVMLDRSIGLLRDRQSFRIVRECDNSLHKMAAMVEMFCYNFTGELLTQVGFYHLRMCVSKL